MQKLVRRKLELSLVIVLITLGVVGLLRAIIIVAHDTNEEKKEREEKTAFYQQELQRIKAEPNCVEVGLSKKEKAYRDKLSPTERVLVLPSRKNHDPACDVEDENRYIFANYWGDYHYRDQPWLTILINLLWFLPLGSWFAGRSWIRWLFK
jgi:hypothetical protein